MSARQVAAALRAPAFADAVGRYYRNTVAAAGVPAGAPSSLSRDQLVEGAYRLFRWLATEAVRGSKKTAEAERQASVFRDRLTTFAGTAELRSIQAWLGRFGQELGRGNDALRLIEEDLGEPFRAWAADLSEAQILTLALSTSRHAKLGVSRAAVFVKLLCRDVGFFDDFARGGAGQALFVPADRTTVGMAAYLLRNTRTFAYVCPHDVLTKMIAHPRSDEALFRLSFVAQELLGSDAMLFEDLWFVGRYYHGIGAAGDARPAAAAAEGAPARVPCALDAGLVDAEAHLFAGVEPPRECPLTAAGCTFRVERAARPAEGAPGARRKPRRARRGDAKA